MDPHGAQSAFKPRKHLRQAAKLDNHELNARSNRNPLVTPSHPLVLTSPLRLLFPPLRDPIQDLFPVLVKLQFRNHHFTGMHPDLHALPVRLLTHDPLDMHYVFEPVDGGDGPFAAFVRAAYDGHFVVFADGDRADLGWEERRQRSEGL